MYEADLRPARARPTDVVYRAAADASDAFQGNVGVRNLKRNVVQARSTTGYETSQCAHVLACVAGAAVIDTVLFEVHWLEQLQFRIPDRYEGYAATTDSSRRTVVVNRAVPVRGKTLDGDFDFGIRLPALDWEPEPFDEHFGRRVECLGCYP